MKTYSARPSDVERKWYIIDAQNAVLGRMASEIAKVLRGKHKAIFTPHIDTGDNVIVINAEKVHLTGNKVADKTYHWHTGYPGGIKDRKAGEVLAGKHPERVVEQAVKRMMPKGPLARSQFKKLKVYAGSDHPHEAQEPKTLQFIDRNPKNTKRA